MFKIADAHNDFLTNKNCNFKKLNEEFKKNNVTLCNAILFSESKTDMNINKAYNLKNKITPFFNIFNNCIFSFENIDFIQNTRDIDALLKFKPFACSLTWNYDNLYAGGALEFGGLTFKGKNLIKQFNDNNIYLDTAHLNRRSFWDAIKITNKPILNTHTCFNIKEHRRNLDIEQVKAIIDSNGFIGITFVGKFLTNRNDFTAFDVYKNIDTLVQKFGISNIGLGSDFYGTTDLPLNLKSYNDFSNLRNIFINHNYDIESINKLFYKNFLDFAKN